ncbi:hypothetical protein K461DRAFT_270000 [Myriangium duriaei CBS 260.36]|uniref:Peroxisomal membrane protein PEX17 n=1 Tax=Myriangium duriaei CBS 260.36 TaxID=1168546 RepID=A0A9P4ME02_9PEZI|nr:hypothetical protein K461DRAFT_270000 [Myriangium duriaei CBS 260.36]
MPADRLLSTLLRALQDYAPDQDTPRLLGTAASLLTTLNNPLNVTLLVNHALIAPALWMQPNGLRYCLTFMGVFHSATQRIIQHEAEEAERKATKQVDYLASNEPHLPLSKWIRAVVEGLDHRSPRSRHLLVLGGVLNGLSRHDDDIIPSTLRATLEENFVKAANSALVNRNETDLGRQMVVLSLNYTFPHLSNFERTHLDYDELLPALMHALLHSSEGLGSGYFLQAIDTDIRQSSDSQFNWPAESPTHIQTQAMLASPLITSIGPLSRLIAHTAENARDPWLVSSLVDDVAEFCDNIFRRWRHNKVSEIDVTEDKTYLHPEAREKTLPDLWRLLRSLLFALVIILRSAVGRLLADSTLGGDSVAPQIATQCLQSLRNLNFIFARLSSSAFSQYTFVHLTCVDILNSYRTATSNYLKSIAPDTLGKIPAHPLDRMSDLFFLNTAEHLTLALSPTDSDTLLIAAATPYLTSNPTPELLPIFESAHSVMLAVFSAPQNAEITTRQLPFYVDALFRAFPQNLSARQFRLAFKNLVKIVSPPGIMARQQPLLAAILLDLVRERAENAPSLPLPPSAIAPGQDESGPPMSEQVVMILTLLDALPFIATDLLEEWLPLLPAMLQLVADEQMKELCIKHLWETIVGGSMDPDRSQVCVGWWTTGGGMEAILYGDGGGRSSEYVMSGALPVPGEAKL